MSLFSGGLVFIFSSVRYSFNQNEAYYICYAVHLLIAVAYSLIAGAFGVLGSWWFVRRLLEIETQLAPIEQQQEIEQLHNDEEALPSNSSPLESSSLSLLNNTLSSGGSGGRVIVDSFGHKQIEHIGEKVDVLMRE